MSKTKSSTDRCRDRWSGVRAEKEISLCRLLSSDAAEVAVLLEHIALIALQSLEYGIPSIFLDRLSGSSCEKLKAGFRDRITSFELVDDLYGH
jgi:hypothetical protein